MGNYKFYPSQGELWWQNLLKEIISTYIPSWKPHTHSLQAMTQGFSPQSGRGEKSNYYNRAPLQHEHILEAELFMLAVYIKAINLQPYSPHIAFEVYIYRAGNMPHNILLSIFSNMVSIDSLLSYINPWKTYNPII